MYLIELYQNPLPPVCAPTSCHHTTSPFAPLCFYGVLGSASFFCLPEKVRRSILCVFFFFALPRTMLGNSWSWHRIREGHGTESGRNKKKWNNKGEKC